MRDVLSDQLCAGNHSDALLFLKAAFVGQGPSLLKYI